jgi:hypothetical protein
MTTLCINTILVPHPDQYTEKDNKVIKVYPAVYKALGELGQLGESYDDIIRRLIKHYKETTAGKK